MTIKPASLLVKNQTQNFAYKAIQNTQIYNNSNEVEYMKLGEYKYDFLYLYALFPLNNKMPIESKNFQFECYRGPYI